MVKFFQLFWMFKLFITKCWENKCISLVIRKKAFMIKQCISSPK